MKKFSIQTHQDNLNGVAESIRDRMVRSCTTWDNRAVKQKGARIAKALDELPKPLVLEDIQRVLKEGGVAKGWWDCDFKPLCDICEESHTAVVVIHEALCDEYEMDSIFARHTLTYSR